jgi:hypothetical protein
MCVADLLKKCKDLHLRQKYKIEIFLFSIDNMAEFSTSEMGETLALLTAGSRYDV